jgi:hypothetical protein
MISIELAIIAIAEIYVIGFVRRFKLDLSGYFILLTQLIVFTLRLMMDGFDN